jgi:G protein beta subunit-like protein
MPSVILATAGYDHTIRFWEAPSGICYRTIPYADSQINRLQITPDKQYLATAGNPHIRFFEINTNNSSAVTSFDGHKTNVTALGFQREGKWMYTASEDHTIKIWDVRAPGCQRNMDCGAPVNTVTLHPNQAELISGDQNGHIRVWDLSASACSRELIPDGQKAIRSIAISPDSSKVIAANNSGACFIWKLAENDTSTFDPLQRLEAHSGYILKTVFSPNAKYLATTSADHTVKLWMTDNWTHWKTLSGHQRWVWDAVFSGDSSFLVTASSDQVARLWDLNQGETIRTYTGHSKALTCVTLSDFPVNS